MKRIGNLWPKIIEFGNLYHAYLKARRGKKQRDAVAQFSLNLEQELVQLQRELVNFSWQPGPYRQFTIYEKKCRIISAAPFRDRVVHHAIMGPLAEALDRRFIHDCYACRNDKGVHRAVTKYQQWTRRYTYTLHLDVRQYFQSIDHDVLKMQLQNRIKDRNCLTMLNRIVDSYPGIAPGKGMAIGNLSSQFFANIYLDDLDHWLKETKQVKAYLRYVDDLVLCGDDKEALWDLKEEIAFKMETVKLRLHDNKAQLRRCKQKVPLFGYQISADRRWLENGNGHKFRRRLGAMADDYARGRGTITSIKPRIASWIGHAVHGETLGLRTRLLSQQRFVSPETS